MRRSPRVGPEFRLTASMTSNRFVVVP